MSFHTLHCMTFHYITLHYIISHYIALHYIISHYITDRKLTLPSACACSIECMYVCAVFDGAKRYARSDVSISGAKRMQIDYGASCLLLPECSAGILPAWSLCQATCSKWGTNQEACTNGSSLWTLHGSPELCWRMLCSTTAVTLRRDSQSL